MTIALEAAALGPSLNSGQDERVPLAEAVLVGQFEFTEWTPDKETASHYTRSSNRVAKISDHPSLSLSGREFESLGRKEYGGEYRVSFLDKKGRQCEIPLSWTNLVPEDAHTTLADGKSYFRAADLLRPTYYQAEEDFQRDGLYGLLPEKRGPREGHKLTPDILNFAVQLRATDPSLLAVDLAAAIQERFSITAHPRSIERALSRQKKNVAESSWRLAQNSRAANIDLCLRRSTAARRGVFQFWGLGHGPFS